MQFGFFDDKRKEYVITTPRTPLPWINYLGSGDFFALVSNTAGGYAFYKDARLRRLTRYRYNNCPADMDGFHFYIKEAGPEKRAGEPSPGSSEKRAGEPSPGSGEPSPGSVWNIGWKPVQTELDSYRCRHGLGYTVFESSRNGLYAAQEMFVPIGSNCLLIRIRLENNTSETRCISLFPFIEFCLWDAMDDSSNFQRNFSTGEVEVEGGAIYHKTEYRERRDHYAVFWANRTPDAFDTARDAFIGQYGSPAAPEAVCGYGCTNSVAHGWQPCAAQQFDLQIAPGKTESLIFGLGYIENPENEKWTAPGIINKMRAREMMAAYQDDAAFEKAFSRLAAYWEELLSGFRISSGDDKLDRMVNIWNQYQCMVTFNMSRSASFYESGMGRGMGFRDSCQDLLGFVHMIPEKARGRILDIAATQLPDGSAYHQYQPLTKRGNSDIGSGFNDDPLWLIAGTDAYIRETGDYGILNENVPFDNDEALAAPLMEHLRRSFNYTVTHLGPHGLPLIGRADWNDCLNLNCFSAHPGESFQTTGPSEGPVAESVFIAGMFVKYGRAYASVCRAQGLDAEADDALKAVSGMEKAVLSAGWDGAWFRRAYDAFGEPVGSSENEEGQIYIEPQGMCVMAGIGKTTGEAARALASVEERLDTKYGIVLLQPAYTTYHLNLGEISSYPPGYKENAGIFCHNNPWITCAETVLGHGNRAFEVYRRTTPAYLEEISEIHRTEPYVYSQMIAGRDAPTHGEAKNSWLTGTAAWSFVSISQSILGVTPDERGLSIDPCIPSALTAVDIDRRFRGAMYHIHVDNTAGAEHGIASVTVDGDLLTPDPEGVFIIPVFPAGSDVKVDVLMG